jgi:NosR/NirI family transcriptional regulator, nitrous oxide reductase regulator
VTGWLTRYARWLHTRWPAGTVERLPEIGAGGVTALRGVTIVGDLAGVPLLKFALDTGARAARAATAGGGDPAILDVAVLGAGVAGLAAAVEARRRGLRFVVLEASEPLFTLVNFPRAKPIYTYPLDFTPAGDLQVQAEVKEDLLAELRQQVARAGIEVTRGRATRLERRGAVVAVHRDGGDPLLARHVVVALGRSGDFRKLGVPGESLPHVFNRLHDPADFMGRRALVVGGGDTALETAIALAGAGAFVTLSYRGESFSRPKPENVAMLEALARDPMAPAMIEHPTSERVTTSAGPFASHPHPPGSVTVRLATRVLEIRAGEVVIAGPGGAAETLAQDVVFVMIGREAPLDFLRRSRIPIAGEMTPRRWVAFAAFLAFCVWLYDLKAGGRLNDLWYRNHWFPTNLPDLLHAAGGWLAAAAADPRTLLGTLAISATGPPFWYTLAYSIVVCVFGVRRIRRRRTPYVTVQTLTLMAIQTLPLFLLPEIVLPLLGHNGLLPRGLGDALFPVANYGHGREYWRAYGFILAWPLNVYNVFSHQPLGWWLAISFVQTFVLIPLGIWFFGKGFYCGWICSCGALAETLGDTHRQKMPHGPGWNRFNLAGQVVLAIAVLLLLVRVAGWVLPPGNWADAVFEPLKDRYKWTVDVFLGGVIGYGAYFWFSGRVWCRFLCPLAALMHVYARFSRFRILAEKKKCISCGQCTAICHQGIDVMSFANKGVPMADPECVRCSACVHVCPTGVLSFGQVGRDGQLIAVDSLLASPVQIRAGR